MHVCKERRSRYTIERYNNKDSVVHKWDYLLGLGTGGWVEHALSGRSSIPWSPMGPMHDSVSGGV